MTKHKRHDDEQETAQPIPDPPEWLQRQVTQLSLLMAKQIGAVAFAGDNMARSLAVTMLDVGDDSFRRGFTEAAVHNLSGDEQALAKGYLGALADRIIAARQVAREEAARKAIEDRERAEARRIREEAEAKRAKEAEDAAWFEKYEAGKQASEKLAAERAERDRLARERAERQRAERERQHYEQWVAEKGDYESYLERQKAAGVA